MKRFIFCILILVSSLCAHGQSVHDSKVANMMNTQDWFALRAFLNENGDSLNGFIELCASALIDTYFNDPHAAADKWGELLDRYGSVLDANAKFGYAYLLMNACEDNGDYKRGIGVCDKLLSTENLDSLFVGHIRSARDRMAGLARASGMRIVMSVPEVSVRLIGKDDFSCEMGWNGHSLPTLFDTGAQISILTKEMADRIGVKYVSSDTLSATKNGLNMLCAIVDSLSVENMTIYNVPVYVLQNSPEELIDFRSDDPDVALHYEKKVKEKAEGKMSKAVIGMPLLKRFARIEFDRRKHMVTFSTERMKETADGSQLCIINNNLYLKYKLNDADIIGYVDTGMGGEKNLVIYNEYYRRHKKSLPPLLSDDTHVSRMLLPGGLLELNLYNMSQIRVKIGCEYFKFPGAEVLVDEHNGMNRIDPYSLSGSFIGFSSVKKMKKIIFDFSRMICVCK